MKSVQINRYGGSEVIEINQNILNHLYLQEKF